MAPLYETLAASSVLELDQNVLDSMRINIDDELKKLDENDVYRVWIEVPILVIVSMLAYFCFIEQLLVVNMGASAIALSLPFSCVLGLLSSMTSSTMVRRRFVWLYASVQFVFVVIFALIFYSVVNVQPVLSILLATFAGCGVAISGGSIIVEIVKLKKRWRHNRPDQQINSLSSLVHAVLFDKQPDQVPIA